MRSWNVRGTRPTRGSRPRKAGPGRTSPSRRSAPSAAARSAGYATATPNQRDHGGREPREHGERQQVAEPDDDRGQDAEEPLDRPVKCPGEARVLDPCVGPVLTDRSALLVQVHGERGLGHLVVEDAELPLDLIDLELNTLELVLHSERLADRRRPCEE